MNAVIQIVIVTTIQRVRPNVTPPALPEGTSTDAISMRVAIAGKGGTGKTTISGTLARVLARRGHKVLAVDADTTPNLAVTLGIPQMQAQEMMDLPRNMMERQQQEDGTMKTVFTANSDEIISNYSAPGPDGVRLLVMGKVNHGGAG